MKWILFDFKTAKEPWFEVAAALYLKKINHFVQLEVVRLKTISVDRENAELKKKYEEKTILEKITPTDFVILLDEKGKKFDSLEFSTQVSKITESGKKRAVFIIGGAFGVSDAVRQRSHLNICLSEMTMNHLVAEIMLLEQFYRSLTIINRIPYHNI